MLPVLPSVKLTLREKPRNRRDVPASSNSQKPGVRPVCPNVFPTFLSHIDRRSRAGVEHRVLTWIQGSICPVLEKASIL